MKKNKEKKKSSFWADFKAFITKGNILDLAVAVVIGGAFNAIITSLVNNIIMPLVGLLTGKASLADLDAWVKAPTYVLDDNGEILIENGKKVIVEGTGAGHIQYGLFLQAIVNFLIIALTIFVVVRLIRKSQERFAYRERAKAEEAPPDGNRRFCALAVQGPSARLGCQEQLFWSYVRFSCLYPSQPLIRWA